MSTNVLERLEAKKNNSVNTSSFKSTNVLDRINAKKELEIQKSNMENQLKLEQQQAQEKKLIGKTITLPDGKSLTITQEGINKGKEMTNTPLYSKDQINDTTNVLTKIGNSGIKYGLGTDKVVSAGAAAYAGAGKSVQGMVNTIYDTVTFNYRTPEERLATNKAKDKLFGLDVAQDYSSKVGNQAVNQIAQGVGGMIPSIGVGKVAGGIAKGLGLGADAISKIANYGYLGSMAASVQGNTTDEILSNGDAKGVLTAQLKALPYSLASVFVEKMGGFGSTNNTQVFNSSIKQLLSTMTDEAKEEVIEGIVDRTLDVLLQQNKLKSQDLDTAKKQLLDIVNPKKMAEEGFSGGAVAGILGGSNLMLGRNSSDTGVNTKKIYNQGLDAVTKNQTKLTNLGTNVLERIQNKNTLKNSFNNSNSKTVLEDNSSNSLSAEQKVLYDKNNEQLELKKSELDNLKQQYGTLEDAEAENYRNTYVKNLTPTQSAISNSKLLEKGYTRENIDNWQNQYNTMQKINTEIETLQKQNADIENSNKMVLKTQDANILSENVRDINNMLKDLQTKGINTKNNRVNLESKLDENQKLNQEFVNKLGINLAYFSGNIPVNEFVRGNNIYLNTSKEVSEDWAIGHGFLHALKNTHPELYTELKSIVADNKLVELQEKTLHSQSKNEEYYKQLALDKELLTEESLGDFCGDVFEKTEIWEKINQKDPNLFQKMIKAFRDFFDSIRGKIDDVQYRKFEDKLADVVKRVNKMNVRLDGNINAATKYSLDNYTEYDRNHILDNDRNIIIESNEQLMNLVDEALNDKKINKALHLGKLNEEVMNSIREKVKYIPKDKMNLLNNKEYDLIVNQSEIRHWRDEKNISNEFIKELMTNLPNVITNADDVVYSKEKNTEGFRFIKKLENGKQIAIGITSTKGTLKVLTTYLNKEDYEQQKKSLSLTSDAINAPNITSITDKVSALSTNIIPQNDSNMQGLEKRLSGEKLLNTQDFIEDIKRVGANVDDNGYVTLYHVTTQANADNIYKSNKMSAKEDGIFFSTSQNAQQGEGRGDTVLKFKVPAEELVLDDIFDDNADVKIPLKSRNKILDVSKYLVKNDNIIPENIKKIMFDKEFYDGFKNENSDKITESMETLEKQADSEDFDTYYPAKQKIKALNEGFDNVKEYLINNRMKFLEEDYQKNPQKYIKKLDQYNQKNIKIEQLNKDIQESPQFKVNQFNVIQESNPMFDDEHVGIRSPKDILTWEEAMQDNESFTWGDFSKEDGEKALKYGRITIYSSYPIKKGVFVSTSYIQAEQYAGGEGNKVYSKNIPLTNVAWINGDEGQYTGIVPKKAIINENKAIKEDNQGRELSKEQQDYFKDSNILDENGKLITMYHGTNADFNIFDYEHLGKSNGTAHGKGFYFTSSEETGKAYGDVKKVYLDIKKPLRADELTITHDEIVRFLNALNDSQNENSDFKDLDFFADYLNGNQNITLQKAISNIADFQLKNTVCDSDIIRDFAETLSNGDYKKFYGILKDSIGYDGIVYNDFNPDTRKHDILNAVVFNSNQVKNIDNINPTENEDIRYSIDDSQNELYKRTAEQEEQVKENKRKFIQYNPTPNVFTKANDKYSLINDDNNLLKKAQEKIIEQKNDKEYKSYKAATELRRTIESAKKSTMATPDTAARLKSQEYDVRHNVDSVNQARDFIKKNYGEDITKATNDYMNGNMKFDDVLENAVLVELFRQNNNAGNTILTVSLCERVAEIQTQRGQEIQLLSLLKRMTPEGQIMYLDKQINKINQDIDDNNAKRRNENKSEKYSDKKIEFSEEEKQQIYERFKSISEMTENDKNTIKKFIMDNTTAEGHYKKKANNLIYEMDIALDDLKERALATIYQRVYNKVESTIGDKINSYQTMSHLLNPKTAFRNMISNKAMIAQEGMSQSVATVLDKVISKKTGIKAFSGTKLTKEQWRNIKARQKFKGDLVALDIALGIDRQIDGFDKYSDRVIKKGQIASLEKMKSKTYTFQNKYFNSAEKLLASELQIPDEKSKEYVRQKFLEEQKNLIREELGNNISEEEVNQYITEDILQEADELAKYQTFQDDTWLSKFFTKTKKLLNSAGIDGFGLGDLVIKYAKTPSNIIMRTVEYSPIGAIKSLVAMKNVVTSTKNGTLTPKQQRKALMDLSRGITGTGLYALGIMLANLGVLTSDDPNEDKEIQRLLNDAGLSGSKVNISAMLRALSGKSSSTKDGDFLMTYNWLQPTGTTIMQGATLAQGIKNNDWSSDMWENVMNSVKIGASAAKTGIDMPAMSTISNMINQIMYKTEDESGWEVFAIPFTDSVSGFIPAPIRQSANIFDTKARQTYDTNMFKKAGKKTLNSIPFVKNTLEPVVRADGTEKDYALFNNKVSSAISNILNQTLPFNVTRYNEVNGVDTLKELQKSLTENKHLPRTYAESSVKIGEDKIKLNDKQKNTYMEGYSEVYKKEYIPLLKKYENVNELTQYQKEMIQGMLEGIQKRAKKAGQQAVKETIK